MLVGGFMDCASSWYAGRTARRQEQQTSCIMMWKAVSFPCTTKVKPFAQWTTMRAATEKKMALWICALEQSQAIHPRSFFCCIPVAWLLAKKPFLACASQVQGSTIAGVSQEGCACAVSQELGSAMSPLISQEGSACAVSQED